MRTMLRRVTAKKGEFDGTPFDYCRIEIDIPVMEGQKGDYGVSTETLLFGVADDERQLVHLRGHLPLLVDVDFEMRRKGKEGLVNVVTHFAVVEPPKQKQQAQQS